MRAKTLSDLLKASDRVAVSNITGREASVVSIASQKYCRNIVGGWALGKGGQNLEKARNRRVQEPANKNGNHSQNKRGD